jgi:hypothetical protein
MINSAARVRDLEKAIDFALPALPDGEQRRNLIAVRRGQLAAPPWKAWASRQRWWTLAGVAVLAALVLVALGYAIWTVVWIARVLNDPLLLQWGKLR